MGPSSVHEPQQVIIEQLLIFPLSCLSVGRSLSLSVYLSSYLLARLPFTFAISRTLFSPFPHSFICIDAVVGCCEPLPLRPLIDQQLE